MDKFPTFENNIFFVKIEDNYLNSEVYMERSKGEERWDEPSSKWHK
jgi:hypothetical protein